MYEPGVLVAIVYIFTCQKQFVILINKLLPVKYRKVYAKTSGDFRHSKIFRIIILFKNF